MKNAGIKNDKLNTGSQATASLELTGDTVPFAFSSLSFLPLPFLDFFGEGPAGLEAGCFLLPLRSGGSSPPPPAPAADPVLAEVELLPPPVAGWEGVAVPLLSAGFPSFDLRVVTASWAGI